jgi:Antirestriction protein
MIESQSWVSPIYTGYNQAYYSCADKICIPDRKQFKEEVFYYTTLLH